MKKTATIILFICLVYTSTAQTNVYHPLPEANASWKEYGYDFEGTYPYNSYVSELTITGDTFIRGTKYHKLSYLSINYLNYSYYKTGSAINKGYVGAFRNDSLHKKVYFISPDTNEKDTLLYDFNLKLGDTLKLSLNNTDTSAHYKVVKVDSFLDGNHYNKRFGISRGINWYNCTYFIEGVGDTFGLFGGLRLNGEIGRNLECLTINGKTIYPDTNYCAPLTSIKQETNNDFSFYINPNPFSNSAEISLGGYLSHTDLFIYNILGTEVLKIKNLSNGQKIERSNLPNGIYFYNVIQNSRVIYSGKLIIL